MTHKFKSVSRVKLLFKSVSIGEVRNLFSVNHQHVTIYKGAVREFYTTRVKT